MKFFVFVLAVIVLQAFQAAGKSIEWKGYTWHVRDVEGTGPPQGNRWKKENVEVTDDDKLRLYVRPPKAGEEFACASVGCDSVLGYGTYAWDFSVSVESFIDGDPNIVLGLFLYKSDEEEIDIEWARWGATEADANNMGFVCQPGDIELGSELDFRLPPGYEHTRHQFTYTKDIIVYKVLDLDNKSAVIFQWNTTLNIPTPDELPTCMNLWMMNAIEPVKEVTSIDIDNFIFLNLTESSSEFDSEGDIAALTYPSLLIVAIILAFILA